MEQSFLFHVVQLFKFFMLYVFNSKDISDTSGFKKLQKYATCGPDSDSFWRCHRSLQHIVVLSN